MIETLLAPQENLYPNPHKLTSRVHLPSGRVLRRGYAQRTAIHERLGDEAEALGIERSRIVWAERVPKAEHLLRHPAADLFVDTLTYGAHSTATDALAGALPFLTLAGRYPRVPPPACVSCSKRCAQLNLRGRKDRRLGAVTVDVAVKKMEFRIEAY